MTASAKPYYTISAFVLLQQNQVNRTVIDAAVNLNILLDLAPAQFPQLFLLLGSLKNDCLFSLPASIFSDAGVLEALMPACYLMASLDQFAATGSTTIPVLWTQPAQMAAVQTDLLKNYFAQQGSGDIDLPVFEYHMSTGLQVSASCSLYVCAAETVYIPEIVPGSISVIAFTPEPRDWNAFTAAIRNVSPTTAADTTAISIEQKILAQEIAHWQKRALLYKQFLQLSKTVQEQEYYEVLNWYRREYEILPLWYKRFGHIIKVIMGKRSFRSLFSDNVKKYRD